MMNDNILPTKLERFIYKINHFVENFRNARIEQAAKHEFERLRIAAKEMNTIKLHFGCGPRILKDWINIDLFFEPCEHYLSSYGEKFYPVPVRGDRCELYAIDTIKTGLPLMDNSVDVVFHEDFIEHLDQKEQFVFLTEVYRVMKPGAIHRINTPDLIESMKRNSNFSKGKNGVFIKEWDDYGHKNILTQESLTQMASLIGYKKIVFNGRDRSSAVGLPLEYRPGKDRAEDGNIFADLIK